MKKQISETIGMGVLLSASGGLMDAYSYLGRGNVFANAQTGNILLLSVNLFRRHWSSALCYFCPVAAFAAGILSAVVTRQYHRGRFGLHWRQSGVLAEAIILLCVALIPQHMNLAANSLISLSCGFQVESFRKISGRAAATTMCIGNMRAAIHATAEYAFTGNQSALQDAFIYFTMILAFAIGAVSGCIFISRWGRYTILCSSVLLLLCFVLMFVKPEENCDVEY